MTDTHEKGEQYHEEHGSLAERLRFLRTHSGLTISALAERTSYSRSSWERYLNGKSLPPRTAITEFAAVVGVPPQPLLRLRTEEGHRGAAPPRRLPHRGPATHGSPGETPPRGSPVPGEEPTGKRPAPAEPGTDTSRNSGETGIPAPENTSAPVQGHQTRTTLVSASLIFVALVTGILIGGWFFSGNDADGQVRQGAEREPGCTEYECRDKDSQRLGCHIGAWTAAATWSGRTYVELRYSPRCRAAWARITDAEVGDTARVEGPKGVHNQRSVTYENDTYSPMVEAPYPAAARACGVVGGKEVCTPQGGSSPLPPALTDEREPARKAAPPESGTETGAGG
ncbi:helix-turn-helix domain-containing protein [Streptomyces sp. KL2]|uniref:helix-turn-helix domain-containing protein n=1 Tax=Streptomyces sp. KL2 TaxID=3050126 RepID=UPI00397C9A5F